MNPFRFRLARLARVRSVQEDIERSQWLAAQALVDEASRQASELMRDIEQAQEDIRRESRGQLSARKLIQLHTLTDRTKNALLVARERVKTLAFQADEQRDAWNRRRVEVEALERLEERQRSAWRQEEVRRETKEMDEVAIQRARRSDRTDHSRPSGLDPMT